MKSYDNLILVIFGASGDLTERKLIPAIFNLYKQKLLPDNFLSLGIGRTALSDESFREKMVKALNIFNKDKNNNETQLDDFSKHLFYLSIDTQSKDDYQKLKIRLEELDKQYNTDGNYIFYLATPPALYQTIPENIAFWGLNLQLENRSFKRLIIEKPFGYDLESGKELNKFLLKYFNENQIYRIDHYLGKETVQNLLVTRFANGIFEPLWNRNYIHHIEIISAESIGVESRGGYYDGSGALRDMVQNHLLQIAGLVAMEPPAVVTSHAIRNEILKVYQSLRPITEENVDKCLVRGQYISSKIKGDELPGYREEHGVSTKSRTETFIALKFFIDNWRWAGVPFYIRTGKRLPTRVTEIVIHFKETPHRVFTYLDPGHTYNQLIIRIQPDEGILLKFGMKVPGAGFNVQTVNMDFHYKDLSDVHLPEAYERLLLDCMHGDSTLYSRGDIVEAAWEFVQPILNAFKNNEDFKIYGYPAGSWGPEAADDLMEDGMNWRYPCKNLADDGLYCEL